MVRHTLDCATLAFLSVCFNSTDVVELLHDQTPDPVDHVSLRPRGLQPTDWVTAFVFTPPCAQWISLDGFYQSFSCSGQLLIKPHTPFCIIDWFPLRNGSHVTPIVSRLKRSWPTSAVNHKVPLTWKIHSDIFSLPPSNPLSGVGPFLGFILRIFSATLADSPSLSPQWDRGFCFVNIDMEATTLKTLNRVRKHRDPWRPLP